MKINRSEMVGVCSSLLILLAAGGCASQPPEDTGPLTVDVDESVVVEPGVPGGIGSRIMTLTAEVEAINHKKRSVTLVDAEGNRQTLTVGPEVANLDQVEKGDMVQVAYAEELLVYVKEPGDPETDAMDADAVVATAPEGDKPAGLAAGSVQVTATISAVDQKSHTAILMFPDGEKRMVPVRDDVEIKPEYVGREVVIRISKAFAMSVDKL
ncbi:MAG: hypothetical protein VYA55_21215 [Pseudomonadota bacterium]|nr:hypothetical protein [Pseudomonadota bacterium]